MKCLIGTHKIVVVREFILILLFSFLMAISSQVKISLFFTPVPVTFQTLVLFLSIVVLNKKAAIAQALYITLGLVGVPVFSKGAGFGYLFGPTGGYLVGFFVVTVVLPYFINKLEKNRYLEFKLFILFCFGNILIYIFGASWLRIVMRISVERAFILGVYPFILGDLFKILLASTLSCRLLKY
jgi:biotin transport system substrate-specific component